MKLKEYIKILKQIEKKYGGDLDLIYGIDEEGNGFEKVFYAPSVKYVSKTTLEGGMFDCMEMEDDKTADKDIAVVCIN